jgi:hypothetical protein
VASALGANEERGKPEFEDLSWFNKPNVVDGEANNLSVAFPQTQPRVVVALQNAYIRETCGGAN